MKKIFFIVSVLTLLFSACTLEKKAVRYKDIYEEKPSTILVMNTIDDCPRKEDRTPQLKRRNGRYNQELTLSCSYFQQSIYSALAKKGYYAIQRFSGNQILEKSNAVDAKPWLEAPLDTFRVNYGVDAVLFSRIFSWKENENDWAVYVDYQLRSAHTNKLIFRTRVKGKKYINFALRGSVGLSPMDRVTAKRYDITNELTQRVVILTRMTEYVLSNLPKGKLNKEFEKDQEKAALSSCIEYFIDQDDSANIQPLLLEQFEQECFVF